MFSQKLGSGSSTHSCALDLDGISRQQIVASREKDGLTGQRDGRFDSRPLPNADIRRSKWPAGKVSVQPILQNCEQHSSKERQKACKAP